MPGQAPTSRVRPLEFALGHQWMSLNGERWTNTESADCDTADWDDRLEDLTRMGLPAPLFIAVSPWKGSAHLAWAYKRPVNNEDPRQTRLRRGVKRGLAVAFGADPRFANRLQKNPWHVRPGPIRPGQGNPGNVLLWEAYEQVQARTTYHTIVPETPRAVALLDLFRPLAAYAADRGITLLQPLEGATRPVFVRVPDPATPAASARGSRLFDAARVRVYRACTADEGTIRSIVQRAAEELGSSAQPAAVDAVAASIRRFMLEDWTGPLDGRPGQRSTRDIDHGAMTREAEADGRADEWSAMSVTEKRAAAALRSAERSRAGNDASIRKAAEAQIAEGLPLTKAAIAARSGVSLSTVKRRWGVLSLSSGRGSNGPNPPLPPLGLNGPEARHTSNQNLFSSSSLVEIARRDRAIRRAVGILVGVAAAASRPGAAMPQIPPLAFQLVAEPAVRKAHREAQDAVADCRRRMLARADRAVVAARTAEMRTQAAVPSDGWRWFLGHLADLEQEWDARESLADTRALPFVRARREATFIGRWRSWKAALRHNRPEPADEEIPW